MLDRSSQNVLITGASGFLGNHLIDRLMPTGAKVRAFVHYNSRNGRGLLEQFPGELRQPIDTFFPGDLTDGAVVRKAVDGCQVIFHLGALIAIPYSYQAPRPYVDTNVVGAFNVLQVCLA